MWRKQNDAKPSPQPSSKVPEQPVGPAPVKTQPPETLVAAVAAPVPAPATPPAVPPATPAFSAPVTKNVITHDTSAPSSIGSGLKIRGELSGSSDLYIDGEAQGKITLADSRVTIGPKGRVQADIEAREIIIEGTVEGNLKARENVRLASSSKVQGSVLTPRIGIDDGAKLRGKVEMTQAGEPNVSAAAGKPAPPTAVYKTAVASSESESSKR
jgi:cytoskeletal protein CcmA (bactofilin family)